MQSPAAHVKTGKIPVTVASLGFQPDTTTVLGCVARRRGAFALESIGNVTGHGRCSLYGAEPVAELETADFGDVAAAVADGPRVAGSPDAPFAAGWVGVLEYEGGAAWEGVHREGRAAPFRLGLYDTVILCDHETEEWRIAAADLPRSRAAAEDRIADWIERLRAAERPGPLGEHHGVVNLHADMSRLAYEAKVRRALDYIAAGDIYQVNLTQRWTTRTQASDLELYRALRRVNPADFMAFIAGEDGAVLSCSPELFLELDGAGRVVTRPIKGTRPRGGSEAEDRRLAAELLGSEKDRAELAMIVDLLRNDLGRVAQFGSVRVLEAAGVEVHPTVLHLVATIEARLRPGIGAVELLRATFPGGSITGCPKIRAMQIICELEPHARGAYCGAIGYIGLDGRMTMSVAIRTMQKRGDLLHIHAGGAITADSDPAAEYCECLAKAAGMFKAIGATPPEAA